VTRVDDDEFGDWDDVDGYDRNGVVGAAGIVCSDADPGL
jgi:hypothetical protein